MNTTDQPLVSVIITCYNYEHYIRTAIDSVLSQDYSNLELIIVDDCSQDRSRDIIQSYDSRVIPVFHEKNQGHGGAFNNGFARSKGDVVMFLDADDFLLPGALSESVRLLSLHHGMCQFRMNLVDAQGKTYDTFPKLELPFDESDIALERLCSRGQYQSTVTSGLMFHRSYLEQVMPMPLESFRQGADGYLVTLAPLYTSVISSSNIISAYRQHGDNHSGFAQELTKRANWRIFHNEMRYQSLEKAAKVQGKQLQSKYWLNDIGHLLEMMCLKLFSPSSGVTTNHSELSRTQLMSQAIKNLKHSNLSTLNQWVLTMWWFAVAILPVPVARPLYSWNVLASSRPEVIKALSRIIRRI